ncbi:UvrB/UvrC motif-containing protein [Clostridium chromiireducens]|uniref:Excinuclease ABC subunit B n=1 Tax=Clostridium chromiireducens TaxID=225345 RepID=A0A1V4IBV7_9CLOT|nr:UvrB/UvrC motif-containing protein [Clostridium chromiireducens]OPJ57413.1 UvrB/uvrC motif protein [Clostridium chromiireducens]RII32623.1 excinuclease ABC subunit B [Clostridium chromiireducens]
MLCEKCGKNDAKVNLITVMNGQKHEVWLCENCVKDIANIPFLNSMAQNINFPLQGMLTEMLSNTESNKSSIDNNKIKEIVCSSCGLTYNEFKRSGKLGCSDCYKDFKVVLEPRIKSLQAGVKHVGKIPKVKGRELVQKRRLKDLKEEMQKLIIDEEYERAAIVRDEIKKLELYILERNNAANVLQSVKEENCNE